MPIQIIKLHCLRKYLRQNLWNKPIEQISQTTAGTAESILAYKNLHSLTMLEARNSSSLVFAGVLENF